MARDEVAHIPPSGLFTSSDKAKILSSWYASVPQEYEESLPGLSDAHFGAMQSLVTNVS